MESSQPQKRWVHGRSEPFVMMAWQLSLLLALRNIVAHRSTEGVHSDLHHAASTVLTKIAPVAVPIFLLLVGSAFALRWMGKRDRVVLDVLGCSLILRTIAGFIALKVLILNPLQGDSLLLRQFLYFMPSLMIGWGWIYWRLDLLAAGSTGGWIRPRASRASSCCSSLKISIAARCRGSPSGPSTTTTTRRWWPLSSRSARWTR